MSVPTVFRHYHHMELTQYIIYLVALIHYTGNIKHEHMGLLGEITSVSL